jgi:hypothetical protein
MTPCQLTVLQPWLVIAVSRRPCGIPAPGFPARLHALELITMHHDPTSAAASPQEVADDVNEAALAEVMHVVPLGAGVLAGAAVAILVLGYLLIYLLVFVPRGVVG